MTQDNKIWHAPTERPIDGACIVSPYGLVGEYEYCSGRECIFCPNGHIEFMRRWEAYAYIEDLLASSKALDVAIEKIRKWNGAFADKPQYGAFALEFKQALQEINEIMKGEK